MTQTNMKRLYLYSKFERFWHWAQATLITLLLITGLEVHGAYELLGFEKAADLHSWFGIIWVILYLTVLGPFILSQFPSYEVSKYLSLFCYMYRFD